MKHFMWFNSNKICLQGLLLKTYELNIQQNFQPCFVESGRKHPNAKEKTCCSSLTLIFDVDFPVVTY